MPVIVFTVNGSDVLVASSGKWLQEKMGFPNVYGNQEVKSYLGKPVTDTPEFLNIVTTMFKKRAENYGKDIKYTPIKFKGPDRNKNYSRFSTKFIYPENTIGFIKGTYPDEEHGGRNEAPNVAASREFKEETGFEIPPASFIPVPIDESLRDYHVFKVVIPDRNGVISSWTAMNANKVGELYNLRWAPISEIKGTVLNQESEAVKQYLPLTGGKRRSKKTRKLKLSKKRGTLKR